jgi:hypothetical protein
MAGSAGSVFHNKPIPLPSKIDDWARKVKSSRTLNDHVEDIHRALWDTNPDYCRLLEAVWDSDAVEGSLAIDNSLAAMMLRDAAKEVPGNMAAGKKLDTLVKSLNVVLRRYENSRRERRDTVSGQRVLNPNDD